MSETDNNNMKVTLDAAQAFDAGRAAEMTGYDSLAAFAAAALKQATQSALAKAKAQAKKAPAGV